MAEKDFTKRYETLTPLERALLVALTETQFDATLLSAAKCANYVAGVSVNEIIELINIESEQRRLRMIDMAVHVKKINAFMQWSG